MLMLQRAARRTAAAVAIFPAGSSSGSRPIASCASHALASDVHALSTARRAFAASLISQRQQQRLFSILSVNRAAQASVLAARSDDDVPAVARSSRRAQERDSFADDEDDAEDLDDGAAEETASFKSLQGKVSEPTLEALVGRPFNFDKMSVVQDRVLTLLPDLIDPRSPSFQDLLVKAKTGTGKTIAFLVPAVEARFNAIQAIKDGTFPRFKPWEDMVRRNRPDLFKDAAETYSEDKRAQPSLDYSALSEKDRNALSGLFARNTAGALIISPTRELATQIATEARKLITHHRAELDSPRARAGRDSRMDRPGSRGNQASFDKAKPDCVHLLVGGASRFTQQDKLRNGRPDIVVATPGRAMDFLQERGSVHAALSACQTLILDEADTLLDMGFREDIRKIIGYLPEARIVVRGRGHDQDAQGGQVPAVLNRQTFLFSATISKDIKQVANWAFGTKSLHIDCVPEGEDQTHSHVPQHAYVFNRGKEQMEALIKLIQHDQLINPGTSKVIVFSPTTVMAKMLSDMIRDALRSGAFPANTADRRGLAQAAHGSAPGTGGSVYELHSKLDQSRRFNVSNTFRSDKSGGAILVTSDVSSRGVDYPGTTRVIQVCPPKTQDTYIHRVGRTGRGSHKGGRADLLLLPHDAGFVQGALGNTSIQVADFSKIEEELDELATKFDAEGYAGLGLGPDAIRQFERAEKELRQQRGRPTPRRSFPGQASSSGLPAVFRGPLGPVVGSSVPKQLQFGDNDSLRAVFMSLLGYYQGISEADIRAPQADVLNGLRHWVVDLTGDSEAGYVSESYLTRIGFKRRSSSPNSSLPRPGFDANRSRGFGAGSFRGGDRDGPRSFGSRGSLGGRGGFRGDDERRSPGGRGAGGYESGRGSYGARSPGFGERREGFGGGDRDGRERGFGAGREGGAARFGAGRDGGAGGFGARREGGAGRFSSDRGGRSSSDRRPSYGA